MPPVLSIHARVEGTRPSTWEHPSLVQLWGPRFSAYVVAARDHPFFSLARLPDDERGRQRAEETAARLHGFLAGRRMTYGEAGRGLGVHGNRLRYAAPTGTVLIRWDGARLPTVWTVPRPDVDPHDARRELARRYLHVFGPMTPAAFAKWAGIGAAQGRAAFGELAGSLTAVRTPIGEACHPHERRGGVPRTGGTTGGRAATSERRRLLPASRSRPRASRSRRRASRRPLDAARLAGCRARRRRDRRDVATRSRGRVDPVVAPPHACRARGGGGGGGVVAAAWRRRPDRRPLGLLTRYQ